MTVAKTVEWLGGPLDGERLDVPAEADYVDCVTPVWASREDVLPGTGENLPPEAPVGADTWRVPILNGKLLWHRRKLRPSS